MRAAMRAVLDGKQVAVLAPTTILAFQHWKTFRKRFAPFPVTVEMVSRFRTAKEMKQVLAGTAVGQGGHPHRHPPHPLQGRRLPRPRPARHRRGAAFRRGGQGEAEAPAHERRLPDPVRHPHPAHAADGAGRDPRHVGHRDPAQGPAGHPDRDRQVLDRRRSPPRSARSWGARARSTSCTTAWSRSTRWPTWCRSWCRRRGWRSPTARCRRRSWSARCSPSWRAAPTCWWRPRSSRTASTSRAPTR